MEGLQKSCYFNSDHEEWNLLHLWINTYFRDTYIVPFNVNARKYLPNNGRKIAMGDK